MKNLIKRSKGVSLISLVITVAVILILTNIVIYNAADSLRTTKLSNMQADIENLRDKVSNYYAQYGRIPANTNIEYTNTSNINSISEAVDSGKFYVIDLAAMENVTLNYGKDYDKITESSTQQEVNGLTDIYIINETSHNVFYVEGIQSGDETYYTDYSAEDADKVAADLRYYDGVEIPDGFYYVGGTKDTGLVISDVQGDDLDNSKQGNQFVWIPVENASDYVRNTSYANVEISQTAYTDTGYLPDGIQPPTDNSDQNEKAERQAVVDAGGFFISRFEAGNEDEKLVSKKGATVWTNITYEVSKSTAKSFANTDSVKSALISGIQWDMVMKFINGKADGNGNVFNVTEYDSSRHKGGTVNEVTGQNYVDKVCNIYDLEGNCREYAAERNSTHESSPFSIRGGYFSNSDSASYRGYSEGIGYNHVSFHFVLYVIPRDNWTPAYDEQSTYTDKNGDTATIPQGFSVSRKPNEKTVDNGLVVKAPDGSEFVWVPVDDINTMSQCSTAGGDCNLQLQDDGTLKCETHNSTEIVGKLYATEAGENFGTVNTTYEADSGLREPAVVTGNGSEYDAQYYSNAGFSSLSDMENGLKQEYKDMATSVAKYKGFYIGRYESSLSTATEESQGTGGIVQSKKGVKPASASNTATNMWYGLYKIQKEYSSIESLKDSNIGSSMIWGSQYDAMINWANTGSDAKKLTENNNGKHKGNAEVSGAYSNDRINNIYDLESNLFEWSLEGMDNYYRVARGSAISRGEGDERGEATSPIHRNGFETTYNFGDDGSRMTLYLK